jgi:protein SCO1
VIGAMLRVLIVGLVLLVAAMMMLLPRTRPVEPPEVATVIPEPPTLPDVALAGADGNDTSMAELAGEFKLMFFGFTNCPDVCPLTLQVLAEAVREIEAAQPELAPDVVFVSVDPNRDSPGRIRAYLRNFDPDFIGVTAKDAALAPLTTMLGVAVHKTEHDGQHYNVVHNGTIYVIGPDNRWLALFGGSSHVAGTVASDYLKIRRRFADVRTQSNS